MYAAATWIILHGGGHNDGAVSFEAVLGSLVTALVVVGVLWYLGVFHQLAGEGNVLGSAGSGVGGDAAGGDLDEELADPDADPESGAGD